MFLDAVSIASSQKWFVNIRSKLERIRGITSLNVSMVVRVVFKCGAEGFLCVF